VVSASPRALAGIASDPAAGLRVRIENPLPRSLPVGSATAIFCFGHCFHRHEAVTGLELVVGGVRHRPAATGMPRRDLLQWLHGPHGGGEDPEARSYRSGFWAVIPLPEQPRPGSLAVQAAVRLGDGAELVTELGEIEIEFEIEAADPEQTDRRPVPADTIAICMTTFEPEISLFAVQVGSLRAQSDDRWRCVISDGGSRPESLTAIREVLGDDPRFELSASPRRLDPYRNFERALRRAPAGAELIALCDQDDRWYPEKLAALRAGLGSASMVYSDQRLVTDDGRVLRDSLWKGRRNDRSNLASLLVANAVPGAAMLFRRELLERALPFPEAPGLVWHDHWLALAALAGGSIAYVDRPLYDYVQHVGAVSGDVAGGPRGRRPVAAARTRRSRLGARGGSRGWRGAYFGGYLPRVVQAQTLLLRCADTLTPRKRRALELFLASANSPAAFAWLALRPLRALAGRGETLGGETALARGVLWRWLVAIAAGRAPGARRPAVDASFPDPPRFEQARLRRWRAGGR
jgi:hypothetical protein